MPSWLLITMICSQLLSVGYAVAAWKRVSDASAHRKWRNETTQLITDLQSSFDSLLESHKRLRSRQGMAELRERKKGGRPPSTVETKAELMQRLGLAGKAGPDFARVQLQLNADDSN